MQEHVKKAMRMLYIICIVEVEFMTSPPTHHVMNGAPRRMRARERDN